MPPAWMSPTGAAVWFGSIICVVPRIDPALTEPALICGLGPSWGALTTGAAPAVGAESMCPAVTRPVLKSIEGGATGPAGALTSVGVTVAGALTTGAVRGAGALNGSNIDRFFDAPATPPVVPPPVVVVGELPPVCPAGAPAWLTSPLSASPTPENPLPPSPNRPPLPMVPLTVLLTLAISSGVAAVPSFFVVAVPVPPSPLSVAATCFVRPPA
jgi:hypothetical protein